MVLEPSFCQSFLSPYTCYLHNYRWTEQQAELDGDLIKDVVATLLAFHLYRCHKHLALMQENVTIVNTVCAGGLSSGHSWSATWSRTV